ncbi:MAG: hypothetical protein OSA92_05290 [Pirellulaceae bacterium]|nr:hypothetical protein [Pirellulaceae bacterium]
MEAIGDARPLEVAEPEIAPKEERQFSFIRAIRASATGDWREAGYEREVSDEIARQSGRTPKGFFAPASAWGQRNLIVGADADAVSAYEGVHRHFEEKLIAAKQHLEIQQSEDKADDARVSYLKSVEDTYGPSIPTTPAR